MDSAAKPRRTQLGRVFIVGALRNQTRPTTDFHTGFSCCAYILVHFGLLHIIFREATGEGIWGSMSTPDYLYTRLWENLRRIDFNSAARVVLKMSKFQYIRPTAAVRDQLHWMSVKQRVSCGVQAGIRVQGPPSNSSTVSCRRRHDCVSPCQRVPRDAIFARPLTAMQNKKT